MRYESKQNDGDRLISVIILFDSEQRGFLNYLKILDRSFNSSSQKFEIIVVANGTGKFLQSYIGDFQQFETPVRMFEFRLRTSKGKCLKAIAQKSHGDWILISGPRQEIPEKSLCKLIGLAETSTDDMIIPRLQVPKGSFFNRFSSMIFKWLVGRLTETDIYDVYFTVAMCRRSLLGEIELFGDAIRFLPVFAAAKGFGIKKVTIDTPPAELKKTHYFRARKYLALMIDIFSLFFNTRFFHKPNRFFSAAGATISLTGLAVMLILFLQRFFFNILIGNRPELFLSLILMILGVLVSSAGLLGEIIIFFNRGDKKEYSVEKVVD